MLIRVAGFDGGSGLFIRRKPFLVRSAGGAPWQMAEPPRSGYDPEMTSTISPFGGWA
jgi:hypothetical protein